jgi:hypothetical protein
MAGTVRTILIPTAGSIENDSHSQNDRAQLRMILILRMTARSYAATRILRMILIITCTSTPVLPKYT